MTYSPIGAIVRQNVVDLLEKDKRTAKSLYEEMELSAARFWEQFSETRKAPRLDLVEEMSNKLCVPLWRLLIQEGQGPPDTLQAGETQDPKATRHFLRQVAEPFAVPCKIPLASWHDEPPLSFRIRQNIAIGCWQSMMSEAELCKNLGIPRRSWYAMFRRKKGFALDILWQIAEELEMEPWELVAPIRTEGDDR